VVSRYEVARSLVLRRRVCDPFLALGLSYPTAHVTRVQPVVPKGLRVWARGWLAVVPGIAGTTAKASAACTSAFGHRT